MTEPHTIAREASERQDERDPRPAHEHGANPISGRMSIPERVASHLGNRNFARMLSRMRDGDGILPGGLVHPDVQTAIGFSRGTGSPLARSVSRQLESAYGESLSDVRVHTGEHAAELARAVSARAFTVGSDIFFAGGEYSPATRGGQELIAHEVAHVVQQRGAPAAGQLRVSQPGDATEREAEAMARDAGS
jgi:Domain of unknown function (DUF4157)